MWTTAGHGDAAVLARQALEQGCTALVAVGGDGTLGEMVNGYLDAPPFSGRARRSRRGRPARAATLPGTWARVPIEGRFVYSTWAESLTETRPAGPYSATS
jgi:hypothetical protein